MSMNMGPARVYWRKNQLSVRSPSNLSLSASKSDVQQAVQQNVTTLNTVLQDIQLQLIPFTKPGNTAQQSSMQHMANDTSELDGIYLFPSPTASIGTETTADIVGFFQIMLTSSMSATSHTEITDYTISAINHLAQHSIKAIPNLLWSGCDDVTHGCPISPPIPAENPPTGSGQWHITLPAITDDVQNATGAGVTVFVLDTLPPYDQINAAAELAGDNNLLLQDMVDFVTFNYDLLSDGDAANPEQLVMTGKDIYGRLVGFPMADHGLFIAGLVHDLAPTADIECIRVLNHYGVGDLKVLTSAFNSILFRMLPEGNLYQQSVVINLSLLVMPPGNDIPADLSNDIQQQSRLELHGRLKALTDHGAIIIASAGNDSDPRDTAMNPNGMRFGPRYPANFAYDELYPVPGIIPVGAVNTKGEPASYSNHPGSKGIATYGGEIPTPNPATPSQDNPNNVTVVTPLDAVCGVYTAQMYPALSMDEKSPQASPQGYPESPAPNSFAWAYWSGTSFAAPIISALAARVLESQAVDGNAVLTALTSAASQVVWSQLDNQQSITVPMVQVVQQS